MIEETTRDRRAERRDATRAEILDAAWQLARTNGLGGLSLGDIARRIGMKTPSLYWYFESKHAVYDAMFVQGNELLLDRLRSARWGTTPRSVLRAVARTFVEFSVEDLARYQLLFQRSLPDFEPSPEAYAAAVSVMEQMRARLAGVGVTRPAQFDMWTALVAGLASQQTANDPDGDRWLRLVDPMVDMFLATIGPRGGST
ncbi:MAG TPA: TetR/AcrR family transcriptional regulator [Acidimicrobiales bacterium]|jgi:AcrR family transcriptional regulator